MQEVISFPDSEQDKEESCLVRVQVAIGEGAP